MGFSNLSVLFYSLVIVFHYYNSLFFTPLLGFTFLHFNVITDMKCA